MSPHEEMFGNVGPRRSEGVAAERELEVTAEGGSFREREVIQSARLEASRKEMQDKREADLTGVKAQIEKLNNQLDMLRADVFDEKSKRHAEAKEISTEIVNKLKLLELQEKQLEEQVTKGYIEYNQNRAN